MLRLLVCAITLVCSPSFADTWIETGNRTAVVHEPYILDGPAPILLLLHGFRSKGVKVENYFNIKSDALSEVYLLLHPNGSFNRSGERFWNATDACCDFDGSGVDDSGYLRALIEEVQALYSVDPQRIYVMGHSNGGFMAHRLACDHPDLFAAVVSIAGATYLDVSDCAAEEPINVLQVHGTDDKSVFYWGGNNYPSALRTIENWMYLNDGGGSAELWTLDGVGHSPRIDRSFRNDIFDYFDCHPKPLPEPSAALSIFASILTLASLKRLRD
jgi:polyhydroxybutyrate depolymerase